MSPQKSMVQSVGKMYAGRASSSPIVDLFITLLSMGMNGYKRLLAERQEMLKTFPLRLSAVAEQYGERLLECPTNTISFGMTLDHLVSPQRLRRDDERECDYFKEIGLEISQFGSMLFSRCVSGTRVVPREQSKTIGDHEFLGFGSSVEGYPNAYMTAACAIGLNKGEMDEFFIRLDKTFQEKVKLSKKKKKMIQAEPK